MLDREVMEWVGATFYGLPLWVHPDIRERVEKALRNYPKIA